LRGELGRDPDASELAAVLGVSETDLASLRHAAEPVRIESLDEAYSDGDLAYADTRPGSFDLLADAELRESVAAAIGQLPERLQLIVQLYFVEEPNLAEIAETLSVSVPRVHQLKAQAIDKLRADLVDLAQII
jgi:RNA polymerase sigma factor for flagellar operon FliA